MRTPDISVVVPTYRRPELIARCLAALLGQTLDSDLFEIVVVDDGHDDATRERVRGIARSAATRIRYLRPGQGRGPAVARNCGWRAASADVVAFTDDDTQPDPAWLQQGLAALMLHRDWVAAAGRVHVPRETGHPPTDHELMTQGLETAEFVTANAFVWRRALQQLDGFDERFLRAWREDSDLHFRLLQLGPVGRATEAVVRHPVRAERWGVSLRQQRNVFFDALLHRKHPRIYRERIRRLPPWDYYLIVVLTLAALLLALAAAPTPALLSLTVALALVLRFAWRRLRATSREPGHVVEMLATSAAIPFLSVYWRLRGALHFRTPFL
ncbi:glycosyltransferase family 2 protein [Roseateles cellulosilyticus]|nr:glycosyltransferase family 2 protein [Pelomonas sp. P8]